MDVAREAEASGLLAEALKDNPFHLEAIYNKAMLQARSSGQSVRPMISALTQMSTHPAHKWRRTRLVAWAWAHEGRVQDAERTLNLMLLDNLTPSEQAEYQSIRSSLRNAARQYRFALAQPRSATELSAEAARFRRLLPKTITAFEEHRIEDARRYLLMIGDLPDYAMHPEVRRLRQSIHPNL